MVGRNADLGRNSALNFPHAGLHILVYSIHMKYGADGKSRDVG